MTPSDLTGLSPLEAAARALEFVDQQNRGLAAKARELRAADRATTSSFEEWLCREMPPNTVIADPKWWASRIERAVLRAQTINGAAPGVEHGSQMKASAEGFEPQQEAAPPSASRKDSLRKFAEDFQQGKAMRDYGDLFGKAGPLPEAGWDNAPPSDSSYWMIECREGFTGWYAGRLGQSAGRLDCRFFSRDPLKCTRFATRREAEDVIAKRGNSCMIATEHMDVQMPEQASAEPVAWHDAMTRVHQRFSAALHAGKIVAWGMPNSSITDSNPLMMVRLQVPSDDQYKGALWVPLTFAVADDEAYPPEADALLRLCLPHVVDDYDLHERIRAYLKAREGK